MIEYAVQAMSKSTGGSGRWMHVGGVPFHRRDHAERLAAERRAVKGHLVAYRVVTREVTPWLPVTELCPEGDPS